MRALIDGEWNLHFLHSMIEWCGWGLIFPCNKSSIKKPTRQRICHDWCKHFFLNLGSKFCIHLYVYIDCYNYSKSEKDTNKNNVILHYDNLWIKKYLNIPTIIGSISIESDESCFWIVELQSRLWWQTKTIAPEMHI